MRFAKIVKEMLGMKYIRIPIDKKHRTRVSVRSRADVTAPPAGEGSLKQHTLHRQLTKSEKERGVLHAAPAGRRLLHPGRGRRYRP